jgi:hypothetical protein
LLRSLALGRNLQIVTSFHLQSIRGGRVGLNFSRVIIDSTYPFKSRDLFHHSIINRSYIFIKRYFNYDHWLDFFPLFLADLIFLIYVYQRWIYPVDKKRVNEFGFGGEGEDDQPQAVDSAETVAAKEEEKKTN